jgi:hypothetical protein
MASRTPQFHAPVFLGTAFFVMGLALLEKVLNVFGGSIPFVDVFPRQLLDWAVALLMFEIALSVRQMIELKLDDQRGSMPQSGQKLH